jgi:hypothetical protein
MKSTVKNAVKPIKLALGTVGCALLLLALAVGPAWAAAGTPPPGWIFELAPPGPQGGPLTNYQQFTTSFIATSNYTYVSFAFREIPAFFAFDNASVKLDPAYGGTGAELLQDPGFESATVGTSHPAGWGQWGQPPAPSFAGYVAGPGGSACDPNGAFGGSNFWCDGAVEGYDGLYQKIATTPGDKYDVSFYLGDNSGQAPYNPGIDMFVYAGDSLPPGTENLPEPSSLVLMGSGVLALGV